MKKCFFAGLLFLTSVVHSFLFAYDYQMVYSNRTALFENKDNPYENVRSLKTDSIKISKTGDSIFYMLKNLEIPYFSCYSSFHCVQTIPSWPGEKVIIQEGQNVFFNYYNDSIKIKTNAETGEKWYAFTIKDSISIEATVLKHEEENFLDIQDMVKTIGFQVFDKENKPVVHPLNRKVIKLSKNHGWIQGISFLYFPSISKDHHSDPIYPFELSLSGLTNPNVGLQNLTWKDVHDYYPGDEIHVVYNKNQVDPGGDEWTEEKLEEKIIFKYLARNASENKTVYTIKREKSSHYRSWHYYHPEKNTDIKSYYNDTIESIITHQNPDFDRLPEELAFDNSIEGEEERKWLDSGSSMNLNSSLKTMEKKFPNYSNRGLEKVEDNCWCIRYVDGFDPCEGNVYIKGLGGPYYKCEGDFFSLYKADRSLVYYKKGNDSWGIPLDILNSISDVQNNSDIVIYPNPVQETFRINEHSLPFPAEIIWTDLSGKVVLHKTVDASTNHIDVKKLPDGMYLYKIIVNDRNSYTGKIIKNNTHR